MDISKWAFKNRNLVYFLVTVLFVGGILSCYQMSKLEDPEIKVKLAMVVTTYPGASAHQVELEVTDVLEKSIRSMGNIDNVESYSYNDLSLIQVELTTITPDDEVEQCWDMLRRKVSDACALLPDGASTPIVKDDFGNVYGMFYALTGDGLSDRELSDYAELIKREISDMTGVERVELYGKRPECINISLLQDRMANLGVKPAEVLATLNGQNKTTYSGYYDNGDNRIRVTVSDKFKTVEDIGSMLIQGHDDDQLRMRDIARIEKGYEEPTRNELFFDSERAQGILIAASSGSDIVKVGAAVEKKLAQLKESRLPAGVECHKVFYQPERVGASLGTFVINLIESVIIVVVILMLAMGFKSGIIIGISLIVTVFGSFLFLYTADGTMQRVSLAAFVLAMGMLVDNAIVVIESIFRNQEKGVSVKEAVVTGTAEVANAVIASTLTTIVVFLPIVYLHGASGELFKDQAWTVTFSLVSSLFVAILVIPMLYTQLSGKKVKMEEVKSIRITRYSKILRKLVRHRWWVIGMAVLLLVVTGLLTPFIGTEFMPRAESKAFTAVVKMPEGTQMERTTAAVGNLEDLLYTIVGGDSLCTIYSHVGEGSGSENAIFEGENTAMMKIILFPECILSPENVIARFLEEAKNPDGLELSIRQDENSLSSLLGSEGAPIVVEVKGEELDEIAKITGEVKERMQEVDGVYDVVTSIEDGAPEVVISIDRTIAGINNLSVATVIEQLKQQLSGKEAGKMEYRGEMRDIVIKVPDISLGALGSLVIRSGTQEFLLDEISSITHGQAPKEILRRNQSRIGKIMANMDTGKSLDKVAAEVRLAVKDIDLPVNYSITVTGEEEKRQESMHSLLFALLLSVVLVYMVMASQFESLLHPFTILLTIPLAVVGAILLFFITGTTINMMGVIGIVMLGGIAVNNSIILVDRINQLSQAGMELTDAIVEAGQQRIRPIIMTTLTTILAMLPMTFGFGEGASLRSPMAIAVIGGLITSTLMSLMVIPCVYYVLEKIKRRINHRTKKS